MIKTFSYGSEKLVFVLNISNSKFDQFYELKFIDKQSNYRNTTAAVSW